MLAREPLAMPVSRSLWLCLVLVLCNLLKQPLFYQLPTQTVNPLFKTRLQDGPKNRLAWDP